MMHAVYGCVFSGAELREAYGLQGQAKDLLTNGFSNHIHEVKTFFQEKSIKYTMIFLERSYSTTDDNDAWVIGVDWNNAPENMTIKEFKEIIKEDLSSFFNKDIICTTVSIEGFDYI